MIRMSSVTKTFRGPDGAVTALDGVDLTVSRGEFVALVGPSGSGKSTLLYTLGGLSSPDTGQVYIGDAALYELGQSARARVRLREVGFVFQTFNLVPYLSCEENVALPALLAGRSREEAGAKASSLLSRVGLSARARHAPAQLSVGERQRVAVARALVNGPKLLLADEPTGNLDRVTASAILDLLLEVSADGQTILMVTHDQGIVAVAHRALELRAGRVRSTAATLEAASA